MSKFELKDGADSFEVTTIAATEPKRIVLFAVGGGGNPERHLPLLEALSADGATVVAPHFERIIPGRVADDVLLMRARRLRIALDHVAREGLPIMGVGHSIGTAMLLAFAGAHLWMRPGQPLGIRPDERLQRIVLMTPPTGFFQVPGALDAVRIPILTYAGTEDTMTPPAQAEFLKQALGDRVPVDLRIIQNAGHFSFMHVLPPDTIDTLADRGAFLADLTKQICKFVAT